MKGIEMTIIATKRKQSLTWGMNSFCLSKSHAKKSVIEMISGILSGLGGRQNSNTIQTISKIVRKPKALGGKRGGRADEPGESSGAVTAGGPILGSRSRNFFAGIFVRYGVRLACGARPALASMTEGSQQIDGGLPGEKYRRESQ